MGKKSAAAEAETPVTEEVIEAPAAVIPEAPAAVIPEAPAAPPKPDPYELVELYAKPPDSDTEDANIVIYVNGDNWVIPKDGGYHKVPRYVREEYERSQRAAQKARTNKQKRIQREKDINARAAALIGTCNI